MNHIAEPEELAVPFSLFELDNEIKKADEWIISLTKVRKDLLKRSILKCSACNSHHEIQNMVFIQRLYWVPPSGCSEGAYWNDGQQECECPNCSARIRLYKVPQIKELQLKPLFKEIKEEKCQ